MDQSTMNQNRSSPKSLVGTLSIVVVIAAILFLNHFFQWYPWPWQEISSPSKKQSATEIVKDHKSKSLDIEQPQQKLVIDYEKIKKNSDPDIKELVQRRKKELGLDKSVDMVVKSGEIIRVGKEKIALNQILAEIEAKQKDQTVSVDTLQSLQLKSSSSDTKKKAKVNSVKSVPIKQQITKESFSVKRALKVVSSTKDSQIRSSETRSPLMSRSTQLRKQPTSYYGIYLVKDGDNLWNIHFAFMREYFASKDIIVSTAADEPSGTQSSGVGRILKYAEKMVYIFNLKTKKLSRDINHLKPLEKIVIFNISNLHRILGSLTESQLNTLRFDGMNLFVTG